MILSWLHFKWLDFLLFTYFEFCVEILQLISVVTSYDFYFVLCTIRIFIYFFAYFDATQQSRLYFFRIDHMLYALLCMYYLLIPFGFGNFLFVLKNVQWFFSFTEKKKISVSYKKWWATCLFFIYRFLK